MMQDTPITAVPVPIRAMQGFLYPCGARGALAKLRIPQDEMLTCFNDEDVDEAGLVTCWRVAYTVVDPTIRLLYRVETFRSGGGFQAVCPCLHCLNDVNFDAQDDFVDISHDADKWRPDPEQQVDKDEDEDPAERDPRKDHSRVKARVKTALDQSRVKRVKTA